MGKRGVGRLVEAGRLLNFSAFRMGAYSRWALIRGWALIRINTVVFKPDHVPVSLFHIVFTGAKKTFTYTVEYDGKKSDMSIAWFFTATR